MKTPRFVWIDDQINRVESYRSAIEGGSGISGVRAQLQPLEVKSDVLNQLDVWAKSIRTTPPDLIIIDHVFNLALPFRLKGSSVAHLLRGAFSSTPLVCVTAMYDTPHAFDQEDISEYTALFLYQQLGEHIEELYVIARDFRKLQPDNLKVREHLVACLKAPKDDQVDLVRILPDEFQDLGHTTTEHRMASWVYNSLLGRAGFLYDRLHVATLLGLKVDSFAKVEPLFEKARYAGVFQSTGRPRWWASQVRKILFRDLLDQSAPDIPQLAGRTLPSITASDHSVCYVSKVSIPPPDSIVVVDATKAAKREVVRHEFSAQHPNDSGATPGFETKLILIHTKKKK